MVRLRNAARMQVCIARKDGGLQGMLNEGGVVIAGERRRVATATATGW